MFKILLINIIVILVCSCSEVTSPMTVTKYKHFNMAEGNDNITLTSHSNKIIAIIHDTLLDSQSVFGETSKIRSKSQKEWESEWDKTHEIFRIKLQKWKFIYVSTINAVPSKIIKQKIDELDKNMFEIIIVKVDVDINITEVRSFIHNVGKADLKIAFWHTDINKCNDGNILYWDGE